MKKPRFFKIICFLALFFAFLFSGTVFADNIDINHQCKLAIHTIDVKDEEPINKLKVNIYKIANIDTDGNYVPIASIDITDSPELILKTIQSDNFDVISVISAHGVAIFSDISVGKYIIDIPRQTIGNITYESSVFLVDIPTKQNNRTGYYIEATPKIRSSNDDSGGGHIPSTDTQDMITPLCLFFVGATLMLFGACICRHEKKKNNGHK